MRIAVFDEIVGKRSPAGSCDLRVVEGLSEAHEFSLFAVEVDTVVGARNPVSHVRIPAPRRPALLGFVTYLLGSCVAYLFTRLRGARFDLVHATDCAFPTADVFYAHFCHKAFLSEVWPGVKGGRSLRELHAWAVHKTRALLEARLVRRAQVIVVPSDGLRRDIERVYPAATTKIATIRNTVDLDRFDRPDDFDRLSVREWMQSGDSDIVFVFVALGHFERKGLPLILKALGPSTSSTDRSRLWVIGGEADLVASYRRLAEDLGVTHRVGFSGRTEDVRPFLWSADAFIAPSHYEAFSLGLLEAAAAELPLIATRISGSEELLNNGVNGIEIDRSSNGVALGMSQFLELEVSERQAMGRAARESVESYGPQRFVDEWSALYDSLGAGVRPSGGDFVG